MFNIVYSLQHAENSSVVEIGKIFRQVEKEAQCVMEAATSKQDRLAAKTLVQYCYSVIEGIESGDITASYRKTAYAKLQKYIKGLAKNTEQPPIFTMEMLNAIGDNFKQHIAIKEKFSGLLPLLCVFKEPRNLTNFIDAGLPACYYGEYEDYGSAFIVIADQMVMVCKELPQLKEGYEVFQQQRISKGTLFWITKKDMTPLLHNLVHYMVEWGLPW